MTEADPFDNANDVEDDGDPFSSPPSDQKISEFVGKLLFIEVTEYETGIVTKFCKPGETKDSVRANVTVIDPKTSKGETYEEVGIMQSVLVGKLKRKVGGKATLGRLIKKPTDKGNDAYDLDQPTDADKTAAKKWYVANRK